MGAHSYRAANLAALIAGAASLTAATPAFAEASTINSADTAWMIVATALVLMMTIPGLALFYSGMVRKKNVLATMAQSLAAVATISILWVCFGYTLAFVGDGPWLGTLDRWFLAGMTMESVNPAAKTIPEALFMLYQMTFAIITVALVAGAVADRMRFSAYLLFSIGWFMFVYLPLAHWVWGGGFLGTMGVLDFAGGLVVHLSAGIGGLVAATAPEIMPSTDGLRRVAHSIAAQVSAPAQAARCVAVIAMTAREFAASADPPLKPNQPTHSNPVPITASDRSNGARFSLP